MPGSLRQDKTIALRDFDRPSIRAADEKCSAPSAYAQHLMSAGMIMLVVEDAVSPNTCPVIFGEDGFEVV